MTVRIVVVDGRTPDGRDPVRVARAVAAEEPLWLWFRGLPTGRTGPALGIFREVAALRPAGLTVAGNFRQVAELEALLARPGDRVALGDAALTDPSLIDFCVRGFGAERVVVVVPWRAGLSGEPEVFAEEGRSPTGRDVVAWCRQAERRGAGELVLVDLAGGDAEACVAVVAAAVAAVRVPVRVVSSTPPAALREAGAAGVLTEA